jgi:3-deoxy-D-manno-octulosonic-acid transferase
MRIYRGILKLAPPFVLVWLLWRRLSGRDHAGALRQRLGCGPAEPEAVRLWLHGASNGELASARWLISGLVARSPALDIVVTSNTETARAMVDSWGLPRVEAALAPVDLTRPLRRFLNRWHPRALVVLENELWPNRIATAREHGVTVLLIGARMSERSARMWQRFPGLVAELMPAVGWLSAQDEESQARFRALGVAPDRIGPVVNLKARPAPEDHMAETLLDDDLRLAFHPATTLLAASTHAGEDEIVLQAFAQAREAGHVERLILAPRHPRRAAEIAELIRAAGLDFATRSAQQPPGNAPVYLADTMGEMDLWYRLSGTTFVGGSLVAAGGHTPFEPARYGSAILHGPEVANFAAPYGALDRAGGALPVRDAGSLAAALEAMADPSRRARLAANARELLDGAHPGGEAALYAALAEALRLPELRS